MRRGARPREGEQGCGEKARRDAARRREGRPRAACEAALWRAVRRRPPSPPSGFWAAPYLRCPTLVGWAGARLGCLGRGQARQLP